MVVRRPNATAFAAAQHPAARCIDALHSALTTALATSTAGPAETKDSLESREAHAQPPQLSIEGSGAQGSGRVDVFTRIRDTSGDPSYFGSTTATIGGTAQVPTVTLSAFSAVTVAGASPRWAGGPLSGAGDAEVSW